MAPVLLNSLILLPSDCNISNENGPEERVNAQQGQESTTALSRDEPANSLSGKEALHLKREDGSWI
jgi:hypothetical protein